MLSCIHVHKQVQLIEQSSPLKTRLTQFIMMTAGLYIPFNPPLFTCYTAGLELCKICIARVRVDYITRRKSVIIKFASLSFRKNANITIKTNI